MPEPVRYRRNDRVLWRRTGDGALLALPDEEGFERLSPSGAAVWELLAEPTTTPEVVAELAELFDASPDTIARDVDALLELLVRRGLIEGEGGA